VVRSPFDGFSDHPLLLSASSTFRIGIVQPRFPRRTNATATPAGDLEKLRRLSLEAAPKSDLILWPETVRPGYVALYPMAHHDPKSGHCPGGRVPILYGLVLAEIEGEDRIVALYNGAILMGRTGRSATGTENTTAPLVEGFLTPNFWPGSRKRPNQDRGGLSGNAGEFQFRSGPTIFQVKQPGSCAGLLRRFLSPAGPRLQPEGGQRPGGVDQRYWWGIALLRLARSDGLFARSGRWSPGGSGCQQRNFLAHRREGAWCPDRFQRGRHRSELTPRNGAPTSTPTMGIGSFSSPWSFPCFLGLVDKHQESQTGLSANGFPRSVDLDGAALMRLTPAERLRVGPLISTFPHV